MCVLVVSACSWLCVFMVCVPGVCMFLVYARQWCVCYRSMHVPGVCMCRQYMGPCEWRMRGSCLLHGFPTVGGSIPTLPHSAPWMWSSLFPAFLGVTGPSRGYCHSPAWGQGAHRENTGAGFEGGQRSLNWTSGKVGSIGAQRWSGPGAPDTLGSGLWAHAQPPIKG